MERRDSFRGREFYPSKKELYRALGSSPYQNEILKYFEKHGGSLDNLVEWPAQRGGMLTDIGIIRHMLAGNILIKPFHADQLESIGYSVRLGDVFFRRKTLKELTDLKAASAIWTDGIPLYDAYDPDHINLIWNGPIKTTTGQEVIDQFYGALKSGVVKEDPLSRGPLSTVEKDDSLIFLTPNEMILGCTEEELGGCNVVTTLIGGKSSVGRHGFEVCSDAFLGEPGFTYKWVLEIANKHPDTAVYLKKGTLLATMVFMELTEPPLKSYSGRYVGQGSVGVDARSMLPRPLKNGSH